LQVVGEKSKKGSFLIQICIDRAFYTQSSPAKTNWLEHLSPGKYNTQQTSLNTVQYKKICTFLKLGKQN